ncbi:MAG TPA: zinc-binding dehydrogenase, partial [Acidimicrobiales bacterium]|nr:zinc-binding dehydrogenase [Acidimicrobiales bacterium]
RPQGGSLSDGTISMGAGLADFVRVRAEQAWPVGAVAIRQAVMGEPLACVAHSLRRGGFRSGDRVVVVGGGYMGRLHLAAARAGGAASVGVVDLSRERLADATAAGATWVAEPDQALGFGGRHDIVFVTAGAPGLLERALVLCDDGGTVVLYGAFPKGTAATVDPDLIHHHELSVIGVYSHEPEDWRTSTGWLVSGTIASDLDSLVTAEFSLGDVAKAFELVSSAPVYRVLVGGE